MNENVTIMPELIEQTAEERETCWQYLKKRGRKLKTKVLGSDNNAQLIYETTTEKQTWGDWFRSFLPGVRRI